MELKLEPLDVEYMFMSLYAPMRYIRKKDTQKDLFEINAFANMLLKVLFHTERIVSKVIPLPIGTSLIAVARKE
jgi:hypothetical protein